MVKIHRKIDGISYSQGPVKKMSTETIALCDYIELTSDDLKELYHKEFMEKYRNELDSDSDSEIDVSEIEFDVNPDDSTIVRENIVNTTTNTYGTIIVTYDERSFGQTDLTLTLPKPRSSNDRLLVKAGSDIGEPIALFQRENNDEYEIWINNIKQVRREVNGKYYDTTWNPEVPNYLTNHKELDTKPQGIIGEVLSFSIGNDIYSFTNPEFTKRKCKITYNEVDDILFERSTDQILLMAVQDDATNFKWIKISEYLWSAGH